MFLKKSDFRKRFIAKSLIVLGMLSGIGFVAMAEFLYPGFTNMAKNDQLYRYGFSLFIGSPIVVFLSIVIFYKIRGRKLPAWVGFEVCEVDRKFKHNRNDSGYNMANDPTYYFHPSNIYYSSIRK